MQVKIYQCFFDESQKKYLDKAFIPYDNSKEIYSKSYFEHVPHKKLYKKNKNENCVWGLVSWRWSQKINITGCEAIDFIKQHPEYDMYHFNPYPELKQRFLNPFVQGDSCHVGLMDYFKRLTKYLNLNINLETFVFEDFEVSYCLYWIGNARFWKEWFEFLDRCMRITVSDSNLTNYMFNTKFQYREDFCTPFPFIHERLITLFMYTKRNKMKFISYC